MGVIWTCLEDDDEEGVHVIRANWDHLSVDLEAFTVFGVAISLFLGFRNNVCFDRWWEGRTAWGNHLSATRNICCLIEATLGRSDSDARRLISLLSAHAHGLRYHLRGDEDAKDMRDSFLEEEKLEDMADVDEHHNGPTWIFLLTGRVLRDMSQGNNNATMKNPGGATPAKESQGRIDSIVLVRLMLLWTTL